MEFDPPGRIDDSHYIETLTLEKVRAGCATMINPQMIDSIRIEPADAIAGEMKRAVLKFYAPGRVTRQTTETVKVPSTWADAFKERFLPTWALRRWPVQYRTIETVANEYHVCPHIHFPPTDVAHFNFLRSPQRR